MKHPCKAKAPPPNGETRSTVGAASGLKVNHKSKRSDDTCQPQKGKTSAAGSTAAQRVKALALLKARPQTTYMLRQQGISHPAARVQELIRRGVPIASGRCTCVDGDGYLHRNVAVYELDAAAPAQLILFGEVAT